MQSDLLFSSTDLNLLLNGMLDKVGIEVDKIPKVKFINTDDESLCDYLYSTFEIIPLEIYENNMEMEQHETKIDVSNDPRRRFLQRNRPYFIPGLRIVVSIPYVGDELLWQVRPSTFNYNPPRGSIKSIKGERRGTLEIVLESSADNIAEDGTQFKEELNAILKGIRFYLQHIKIDVENFNNKLRSRIGHCIANRRKTLGKYDTIAKALNIPLKRKQGAPDLMMIPVKRRVIQPLPTAMDSTPEPGVSDEEYEYILKIIRHEGRSFESAPETFSKHDEEGLRNIILAHLNGHYEGLATGETFRKCGKTDIRIEDRNRAAFIAECKIWRGAKEFSNAIDQLLGYLTWRDCKTALIVFNKNIAGFSSIQEKIPQIMQQHPNYIRQLDTNQYGEWRIRARSADDAERLITIHLFLFNIYVDSNRKKEGAK